MSKFIIIKKMGAVQLNMLPIKYVYVMISLTVLEEPTYYYY